MPKRVKIVFYSVGAWIAALVLLFSMPSPRVGGFSYLLSFAAGASLFTVALVSVVSDKDKIASLLAILLVVVTAWLSVTKATEWGAWIHFQFNRGRYEAKLAEVLAVADEGQRHGRCGVECHIISNEPAIISFNYSDGVLDWYDFVYDPTGAAMQSEEDKSVRLYSFRVEASPLGGDWYWVHYSD